MANKQITSPQNGRLGGRPSGLESSPSRLAQNMFYAGASLKEIAAHSRLPLSTLYRYSKSWARQEVAVGVSEPTGLAGPMAKHASIERLVMQNICRALRLRPVYVNQPFERLLSNLADSKVDMGMSSLGSTEERQRRMDFTASYTQVPDPIHFYARKDARVFSFNQIFKGRFGAVRGTLHEPFLRSLGVSTRLFASDDHLAQALLTGKIDAMLCNEAVMSERMLHLVVPVPFGQPIRYGGHVGIALAKTFRHADDVARQVERMVGLGLTECLDGIHFGGTTPRETLISAYRDLQRALSPSV